MDLEETLSEIMREIKKLQNLITGNFNSGNNDTYQ